MAFPRNSLRAFLSHAKIALRSATEQSQKVTLVIGNESADLDSLSSSLVYAYIRSCFPPRDAFTPLYIPVTNLQAADLKLRPEFLTVCRHANIELKHLITLDDFPSLANLKNKLKPENTKWILVDHNKLQGTLGELYGFRVGGVIDHHDDEHALPPLDTNSEPRVIEKCGSCTSRVVHYSRDAWDQLSSQSLSAGAAHGQGDSLVDDSAISNVWDAQLAKLALAAVLIDTADLSMEGKVEAVDVEAVDYLEAKINLSPRDAVAYDRRKYYSEVNAAKKDIAGLHLADILRKDYKQWDEAGRRLGISSIVKPLDWLVRQSGEERSFSNIVRKYAEDRSLSIYAIMTAFTDEQGKFERELFLWAKDPGSIASAEEFVKMEGEELGLETKAIAGLQEQSADTWQKAWVQRAASRSRKQVAPLLRKAIKG